MEIEPEGADAVEHHGPRKQERDFQIEHDEQDGDEVITHVELHAAVFEGFEAALIGREFLRVVPGLRLPAADDEAQRHQRRAQAPSRR